MNGTRQAIAFLSVLALSAAWMNARAASSTTRVSGSIEIGAGERFLGDQEIESVIMGQDDDG